MHSTFRNCSIGGNKMISIAIVRIAVGLLLLLACSGYALWIRFMTHESMFRSPVGWVALATGAVTFVSLQFSSISVDVIQWIPLVVLLIWVSYFSGHLLKVHREFQTFTRTFSERQEIERKQIRLHSQRLRYPRKLKTKTFKFLWRANLVVKDTYLLNLIQEELASRSAGERLRLVVNS